MPGSPNAAFQLRTDVIDVKPDCPDANREVFVFPIKDIQGVKNKKAYFNGYSIMMYMDVRHFMDDENVEWYRARLYSDNQVLLTYPSFPYTLLHDREYMNHLITKPSQDGMDDARHVYSENKQHRQFRHLLLNFPPGSKLSTSEIYAEAGEDEELELNIIPIEYSRQGMGRKNTVHYVEFQVARTDIKPSKKGRVDTKDRKKSRGAEQLSKMGLG